MSQKGQENRAAAQALFDAGRRLMEEGKAAEACPKFEESQRLDPGVGTQFHLANCYETIGRTASAWTLFLEVAAQANAAERRAREKVARERAAALESKLAKLVVKVPENQDAVNLVIKRDGITVGKPQWGTAVPVDPGQHIITASAPGKTKFQISIEVYGDSSEETVVIPPLQESPTEETSAEAKPPIQEVEIVSETEDEQGLSTQQLIAIGLGGVGVVGLVVGSVFGSIAISKDNDSGCTDGICETREALELNQDARNAGDVATVAFIAGAAAIAAGVVLFFVPFDDAETDAAQVRLTPLVSHTYAGVECGGNW